jgi:hypothetical protein
MNTSVNRRIGQRLFCGTLFAALAAVTSPVLRADQWTAPTKEELSMTSIPEVPGAAAVYLNREETTEDKYHAWSVYVRLKVLTEKGKDYANVELKYAHGREGAGYTVGDIEGRTIHPDGTVIPFTGKPYEKLIEKSQDAKYMAKVFTLPDVEIGSIIEYRYTLRYDDHYYMSPDWFIQSELFLRKGRYVWKPTSDQLVSKRQGREQLTSTIGWFPVLPAGTELKQTRLPGSGMQEGQLILELNVHDIPPSPKEEFMPPISAFTYRVLFYYSPYRSLEEFWKSEGKYWSKDSDKFIGPGPKVSAAVRELTAPSDTADQKLRKLYAAVMQLENTDFTREHDRAEDKAAGLREVHNTDDILERKRGSSDQLAELFIAMARAAGVKAYPFAVTNRNHSIFTKNYLSMSQLDDIIVVANVDGKEQYFDPGSRYCPYGHLEWKHTFAGGLRQVEGGGTVIAETSGESYTLSRIQRVANLNMDEHGEVTGTVKMTFMGAPALTWRHRSLSGDQASLERELRTSVERLLPGGMEVKVASIEKLANYEEPLSVLLNVKGPIGAPTGKRLLIPGDIFVSNEKASFPHEKRDIPVYFDYTHMVQDAVRVNLPASIKIESVPPSDKQQLRNNALYNLTTSSTPNSVTVRRDFSLGEFLFPTDFYAELRSFYNKMETKDQESVVLTASPVPANAKPGAN